MDPVTCRSYSLIGDKLIDRAGALDGAVTAARQLSVRQDGSIAAIVRVALTEPHSLGTTVFVDGWNDPNLDDSQMRQRIDTALLDEERQAAEREAQRRLAAHEAAHRGPTWHDTAPGSVTEQWQRISRWLAQHVDRPPMSAPADRSALASAMEATGRVWPDELVELFELTNGDDGPLPPAYQFLSVDQVADSHRSMVRALRRVTAEIQRDGSAGASAGGRAYTFLPEFVPFAGLDANSLVVDTRPGPLSGCVTAFDKSENDDGGPLWTSISAMLTDLADSLETRCKFGRWWTPLISGRQLAWTFES